MAYPARGVATLWEPRRENTDALGAVLGRGRIRLLVELDTPSSTTELAGRTGMTAGGVSPAPDRIAGSRTRRRAPARPQRSQCAHGVGGGAAQLTF
ncbi:hypothetical protein [Micromonospora sp. CPCC 206061]|uniref:hypothetical protein n=1 Tax=Micromonospora sp. CPCC 206061 TaxID=3122410 RepID=UPI002FF1FEE8